MKLTGPLGLDEKSAASGKPIGRPRLIFRRDQVAEFRQEGLSWRQIAVRLGASPTAVRRAHSEPATAAPQGSGFGKPPEPGGAGRAPRFAELDGAIRDQERREQPPELGKEKRHGKPPPRPLQRNGQTPEVDHTQPEAT